MWLYLVHSNSGALFAHAGFMFLCQRKEAWEFVAHENSPYGATDQMERGIFMIW